MSSNPTSSYFYITDRSKEIVSTTLQLNQLSVGLKPDVNDKNTFDTDSVHDDLHQLLKKTITHDDDIFQYTEYSGKSVEDNLNVLYIEDNDIPGLYGNIPKSGQCDALIFDAGHNSSIPGINNFLDSASTPNLNEVIDSMRLDDIDTTANTYAALTNIGAKNAAPETLYKFTMFNSKLNVTSSSPPLSKNKLDYTAYSNYDILIFIYAIKTVFGSTITSVEICDMLNNFFDLNVVGFPTLDSWKLNKLQLITLVNLNFLWICTMRYINQTLNEPKHQSQRLLTLKMMNIRFIEMKITPKSNIKEVKYQLGSKNLTSAGIDLKRPQDYIGTPSGVELYVNTFVYKLLNHYNQLTAPSEIKPDSSFLPNTYLFYTSQPYCARRILEIFPKATVKVRNDSDNSIEKEDDMTRGIDQLFNTTNIIDSNDQIFVYRILKFQGDTTHLVISHIINSAYKNLNSADPEFKCMFNGVKFLPSQQIVQAPVIKVLTGERPLFVRAILEGINIKSDNFKVFHKYYDPGTIKFIKHEADKCSFITYVISTFNKCLNTTLTIDSTWPPPILALARSIHTLYKEFVAIFNTNMNLNNGKKIQETLDNIYKDKHDKAVAAGYTSGAPPVPQYTSITISEYLQSLNIKDSTKCEQYINDEIISNLIVLSGSKKLSVFDFFQYCSHFISMFRLFDLYKDFSNTIGQLHTDAQLLDLLKHESKYKNVDRNFMISSIERISLFYNTFYSIFENIKVSTNSYGKLDIHDKTPFQTSSSPIAYSYAKLLINTKLHLFVTSGVLHNYIAGHLYKDFYLLIKNNIQNIIDKFNCVIKNFYNKHLDINVYSYNVMYKVQLANDIFHNNQHICYRVYDKDNSFIENDLYNRYYLELSDTASNKTFVTFIKKIGEIINLLYSEKSIETPNTISTNVSLQNKHFEKLEKIIMIVYNFTKIGNTFKNILLSGNKSKIPRNKVSEYIQLFLYNYELLYKLKNTLPALPSSASIKNNPFPDYTIVKGKKLSDIKDHAGTNMFNFTNLDFIDNFIVPSDTSLIFSNFENTINILITILFNYINKCFDYSTTNDSIFLDKKLTQFLDKSEFSFDKFRIFSTTDPKYFNTLKFFLLFNPECFNITNSNAYYNSLHSPIGYDLPTGSKERLYNYIIGYLLNCLIQKRYYYVDLNHTIQYFPESATSGGSGKVISLKKKIKGNKKSLKKIGGMLSWLTKSSSAVVSSQNDEIKNINNLVYIYLNKKIRSGIKNHQIDFHDLIYKNNFPDIPNIKTLIELIHLISDNVYQKLSFRHVYKLNDITNITTGYRILEEFVKYYMNKYNLTVDSVNKFILKTPTKIVNESSELMQKLSAKSDNRPIKESSKLSTRPEDLSVELTEKSSDISEKYERIYQSSDMTYEQKNTFIKYLVFFIKNSHVDRSIIYASLELIKLHYLMYDDRNSPRLSKPENISFLETSIIEIYSIHKDIIGDELKDIIHYINNYKDSLEIPSQREDLSREDESERIPTYDSTINEIILFLNNKLYKSQKLAQLDMFKKRYLFDNNIIDFFTDLKIELDEPYNSYRNIINQNDLTPWTKYTTFPPYSGYNIYIMNHYIKMLTGRSYNLKNHNQIKALINPDIFDKDITEKIKDLKIIEQIAEDIQILEENILKSTKNAKYYSEAEILQIFLISTGKIIFNDPVIENNENIDLFKIKYDYIMMNCSDDLFKKLKKYDGDYYFDPTPLSALFDEEVREKEREIEEERRRARDKDDLQREEQRRIESEESKRFLKQAAEEKEKLKEQDERTRREAQERMKALEEKYKIEKEELEERIRIRDAEQKRS